MNDNAVVVYCKFLKRLSTSSPNSLATVQLCNWEKYAK